MSRLVPPCRLLALSALLVWPAPVVAAPSTPATPSGARATPATAQTAAAQAAAKRPPEPRRRSRPHRALGVGARANAEARDFPSSGAYINSALFYAFEPGRIYTIQTSPRFLTTIQLRAGERLIAKAAGDTVRWVLGETQAGAGETAQVTVFVKPIRPGLRTNIVLTTDQRTYLIDAFSNASATYTSVLAWTYPQEEARASAQAAAQRQAAAPVGVLSLEGLNFNYRVAVRKGRPPAWRPVRVFDDGAKTFIEFPADLDRQEAPPLFVLGEKDQAELVNYRQAGRYYVVDRLLGRAELRLGQARQTIVRIERQGAGR
ncbi:P-type conjugative transfer protein TrbG [Caulobacter segnis]